MNAGTAETRATVMVACPKCGKENPSNLKFCGNCGTKLTVSAGAGADRPWGLALMMISTSLYLVVYDIILLSSSFAAGFAIFALGYFVSALLGLYASYRLLEGGSRRLVVGTVTSSVVVGFAFSFVFFILLLVGGGAIGGTFAGPVWIFFAVMGWFLWKTRKNL